MLSKVYHGHSFYHACRYIVTKQGSEVLYAEGVRSYDFKLMANDFIMQQQLRPAKEKACFHCSLSFYPGEVIGDDMMMKIAKVYLQKLSISDTQFSIIKHTDRRHPHLHIVANLVNNKGKAISDSYLGLKGKKIAQAITEEYKLKSAITKNLALTNIQALRGEDVKRYAIYQVIKQALPLCRTIEELEKKLTQHQIQMQFKFKRGANEVQGISFKFGDNIFKGSSIDRSFSYNNLKRQLGVAEKEVQQHNPSQQRMNIKLDKSIKPSERLFTGQTTNLPGKDLANKTPDLLEILMRPEQTGEQIPGELMKAQRRKKRKDSGRDNCINHFFNQRSEYFMSELLLNTIIDKLNMESQVVDAIRERVETLPDNTEALKDLNTQLASIQKNIGQMSFPETDVRQLSIDVNRSISILQQPVKNQVVHQHHIPKLLWITAGLFLMLCLVCSGWYMTHDKLKNYIAADTKYRYLNLDSDKNLQKLLLFTDSLYNSNLKMRDDVIRIEEEKKERAELQKQADEKQKEVNALRLKAGQRQR